MSQPGHYRFGQFRLDLRSRCLLRGDIEVPLQPRLLDLLAAFVSRPGELLTKEELIAVGWPRHDVADNSLTQAISRLRAALDEDASERYIRTAARRGYRFVAPVARDDDGMTDVELDDLMAPHIALLEGRTMLETLATDRVEAAVSVFTHLVARDGRNALNHVGLANAFVLRYDALRSAVTPDHEALRLAVRHAREARRLAPALAEAWATYGFVIERTGDRRSAQAALVRATTLEPDQWVHLLRLAWCSWGEHRVRAARRALLLRRGLPAAHWLVATVHVARNELDVAEREVDLALEAMSATSPSGFSGAGIYWLKGLLCAARENDDEALTFFERERALEPRRHLYGRECCAGAWYGTAAIYRRRGDIAAAGQALREVVTRVPGHRMARAAMQILSGNADFAADAAPAPTTTSIAAMAVDEAMARALVLDDRGAPDEAAAVVTAALATVPSGSAGWLLPIDPMLNVQRRLTPWRTALVTLEERTRAWT